MALDGIAMIVHPGNPVAKLSMAQVKDIYLGKIKNWSQLGGPNTPIVIISRDTNSGTYETFEGKVMKGEKIAKNCEYVGSNGAIRQRVQSTPAALGYVGIGFLDNTVKALPIDNVTAHPRDGQERQLSHRPPPVPGHQRLSQDGLAPLSLHQPLFVQKRTGHDRGDRLHPGHQLLMLFSRQ